MKILFLARLYSPHVGGVENHVYNVTKLLKKHDITLVTTQHDINLPLEEVLDRVKVWRIPPSARVFATRFRWSEKLGIWWWFWCHLELIRNAEVIHIHDVFFWILPFRLVFFWKKFFMTFHGFESEKPTLKQIFWHRAAAALTSGNICVGSFHQKWYGVKPDVVTYGAVDLSTQKVSQTLNNMGAEVNFQQSSSVSRKVLKIIFVGRLERDTGIELYLRAVENLVQKTRKNVSLDIYGDGELRKVIESRIKNGQLPAKLHGFIDNSQIPWSSYKIAYVSGYLTILEALASGLQVVAVHQSPLKYDYLSLAPFASWIQIGANVGAVVNSTLKHVGGSLPARGWARVQSWELVVQKYKKLWRRK